jgi:hypothetical protein
VGVEHQRASRWLFLLEQEGMLELVEKGYQSGSKKKATRYRYTGPDSNQPDTSS